jgi:hypothetical protein
MAHQVSPLNDSDAATEDAVLNLAGTLASLPQEWTALRARSRDEDVVDAVLVHPDIGVALVSLAPIAPEAVVARSRERLSNEHFEEFFPGALPIVVLGITLADIPEVEQRLAAAFRRAPKLAITDRDWADAVVELLVASSDLEMLAASGFAAFPPEPVETLGASDPEVESTVPPAFSTLRSLASRADDDTVQPAPNAAGPLFAAPPEKVAQVVPVSKTGGRGDWLVPVVCTVVFVAEFGIALGLVEVNGLLPYSTSPGARTETPSLHGLEVTTTGGELWQRPAPEGPLVQAAEPLIASSLEPPTQMAAVADNRAQMKGTAALKVVKFRRHRDSSSRVAPTTTSGEHHARIHRHAVKIGAEIKHGAIDLWVAAKAALAAGGEKVNKHSEPRRLAKVY